MNDFGSDGVVIADEVEPGHFVTLSWRDKGLSRQQVRLAGQCAAFRQRKLKTSLIVERITGDRDKARVPHEPGKEDRIDDRGRAAHIARPGTMRPHHLVAVNANGDGLGIAKTGGRGVTARAGIVVVQAGEGIEP